MKKLIALVAVSVALCGCRATQPDAKGEPVVSPTHISDQQQGSGAPAFPNYTPWWKF